MQREELRETLRTLVSQVTGNAPPDLTDGDLFLQQVELDSLSFVSLILEIEEQLDVAFVDRELKAAVTVGSLLDLILAKVNKTTESAPATLKLVAPDPAPAPQAIQAAVRAVGSVTVPIAQIGAAREKLVREGKDTRAQSVMRVCDDQTVLGAMAVKEAMRRGSIEPGDTTMWNLVASSRYLGRLGSASAWRRFQKLGPSRMSPLIIPFVSLHAGASVLSLYFEIHGPTFGVGGCADNVSQGLLTGLTAPISAETPGTWMVFTSWEPEPAPNEKGETATPSTGYAVAVALTESASHADMRIVYELPDGPDAADEYPSMRQFVEAVSRLDGEPCKIPLSAGGTLIIEKVAQSRRAAA
jgi:acyl carrier protein